MSSTPGPPRSGSGRRSAASVAVAALILALSAPHAHARDDSSAIPTTPAPVDFEVGVITGDRSLIPFFSWLIPGPDDGMVAVERARVEGMVDFLVVPHTHTFIMNSRGVIDQTKRFLREGSFEHDDDEASS